MTLGYRDLLDRAERDVNSVALEDALGVFNDPDSVFVDIRDPRELDREGFIPNALHAPRGMLEFWIDPLSPYHKDWFAEDKHFVFYCASGWRSLLAAQVAQSMGLKCSSLRGGFGDWKRIGNPVETRDQA